MKKLLIFLILAVTSLMLCGCSISRNATITGNGSLEGYRYAMISPPNLVADYSTNLVCGQLMNHGFVIVSELTEATKDRTIIVNYGESGKDWSWTGHVTDVTIQILDAVTYEVICTASAEGYSQIDAEDVRAAVNCCFDNIFHKQE